MKGIRIVDFFHVKHLGGLRESTSSCANSVRVLYVCFRFDIVRCGTVQNACGRLKFYYEMA